MFNLNFLRFDKKTQADGFVYKHTKNIKEFEHEYNSVSMDKTGFTIHTRVQNFLAQPVLIGGNLRANPTMIASLLDHTARVRDDHNNYVIITILSSENSRNSDPKKRTTHTTKTEIRVPGKMLNKGSVFITELDCYLMTESQIDATRELIAKDVTQQAGDSINLPASMLKQEPAKIYTAYKPLVQFCLEQQDRINIRIGVDLRYDAVPNVIKEFHVGILDSYFVPYTSYKLEYDPTLGEDEFVIENLHLASRTEFKSTFKELQSVQAMYLDYNEGDTMFGTYYQMALFNSHARYAQYVYERKTQERFQDETLYLANRSGDPRLKEEIGRLEKEAIVQKEQSLEKDTRLGSLTEVNKRLKIDLKDREDTINKIRIQHDKKMDAVTVISELDNDRQRMENDQRRIENERLDLIHKERAAPLFHRANKLKTISEMLKSGWGIATACFGGLLSIIAICKKYNIKLVMTA